MTGFYLVFEGGDGAGKSTQLTALQQALADTGREIVVTREPGGTSVGQAVRDVLLHGEHVAPRAEALLFAADRAHHVATVVRPALQRGAIVLQDRYLDSSIAYQGAGRALQAHDVRNLSLWGTEGLLPDLTVLLDVPAETGRQRRGDTHDRLEREADDFHGRVREHFLALAAAAPERYLVLDGTLPPGDLAVRIEDAVRERLS